MKRTSGCISPFCFGLLMLCFAQTAAGQWPRFRGPNGSGVSEATGLPVEFGPGKNVLWKTAVPFGRSSPIIEGDRLFLTASEGNDLIVLCFHSGDGRILWRQKIVRQRAAAIYRQNDPASPTPVADRTNVYAFFADLGLVAFGPGGKERWRVPLGPFTSPYGMANSPILYGETLVQLCDSRIDPFLIAVDRRTGRTLWKVKRPTTIEGFSTPVVRNSASGGPEVVVFGSRRLDAYALGSGKTLWWIDAPGYLPKGVPVLGYRDSVFLSAPGSDSPTMPAFPETLKKLDANGDGKLERAEVRANEEWLDQFDAIDTNADKYLEESEYNFVRTAGVGSYGFAAIDLGSRGRATEARILWRHAKTYPNIPAPILYRGILYGVKNGGIIVALDPATGRVLKEGRTKEAMEAYSSSPVAADGKIYTVSEGGKVSVINAGADWEVLKVNDLDDECWATPAIASGRIYIRTRNTLFCFADKNKAKRQP